MELEGCAYSVPYNLLGKKVELWYSHSAVEVFFRGKRVALHPRLYRRGDASTLQEHMPLNHQYQKEKWNPGRILNWASSIGPNTTRLVKAIMEERNHPVWGYKSCLAILNLSKRYDKEALESAAAKVMEMGSRSVRSIESMLRLKFHENANDKSANAFLNRHENIHGAKYYANA